PRRRPRQILRPVVSGATRTVYAGGPYRRRPYASCFRSAPTAAPVPNPGGVSRRFRIQLSTLHSTIARRIRNSKNEYQESKNGNAGISHKGKLFHRQMKTGTLVLALLTATVQTVGWVECCCILICKHRNDPCS